MGNSTHIRAEVVVCVPVYNEIAIIEESLRRISDELSRLPGSWHIVVCDNGSSDGTGEKVVDCALSNVTLFTVGEKGKGAAVRAGASLARSSGADLFCFIDADISPHPRHIVEFYHLIKSDRADVVIGSRFIDSSQVRWNVFRTATSRIFNWIRSIFLTIPVRDTQCGLKIFNQKALGVMDVCREKTWFLDMEFLAYAHARGVRILERPVEWNEHIYPGRQSKLRVVRDGILACIAMIRIRYRMIQNS